MVIHPAYTSPIKHGKKLVTREKKVYEEFILLRMVSICLKDFPLVSKFSSVHSRFSGP